MFARCAIRDKFKVPTNVTLQVVVCRILESFVIGIHLPSGTCLKICLGNPETYRYQIVRFSGVQFGLVIVAQGLERHDLIALRSCQENRVIKNLKSQRCFSGAQSRFLNRECPKSQSK